MEPKTYVTVGWEERLYNEFKSKFPEAILVFYINHLRWEVLAAEDVYRPAPQAAA